MGIVKQRYGHFETGIVKYTIKQKKKHVSQMTENEKRYLIDVLKHLEPKLSRHIKSKTDIFHLDDIRETLENVNTIHIVEYNETIYNNQIQHRVLLRSTKEYPVLIKVENGQEIKQCNLCFVISLDDGYVITAYYNDSLDNHKSLDLNRYSHKLEIIKRKKHKK